MTPQEQQLLDHFLQRVNAAQGTPQDPQAQALIQQRLATQPDASYLLVQRALLLEQALHSAQQHIAQLQQQVQAQQPPAASSFLGAGLDTRFGRPAEPAATAPGMGAAPAYHAPAAAESGGWRQRWFGTAPAAAPVAPAAAVAAPSAAGSFLGATAASAAGVAGGMFLFNGLENLLGGHHGSQGVAANPLAGNGGTVVEHLTENVYMEDPSRSSLARDAGADRIESTDWSADDGGFLDGGDSLDI